MKTVKYFIAISVLIACFLASSAYSQTFWYGGEMSDYLDPDTDLGYVLMADIYHDYLAEYIVPQLSQSFNRADKTDNNPEDDKGLTIYEPDQCWNGYTLLSSMSGYQPDPNGPIYNALLIDMEGNLVHKWAFTQWGVPMKMLPGGYVIGGTSPPDFEGHPTQLDWDGNVVWEVNIHVHHDHQREGNPVGYYVPGMESMVDGGKTLFLDHAYPDPNITEHISDFELIDDVVYEVDWEGNVIWAWNVWEHYEQMGFDDVAKEAIRKVPAGRGNQTDWIHTNSASWLGPNKWYDQGDLRFHPDNIIVDYKHLNLTTIIARHDHPDGQWQEGDIIWKVGPDFSYGNPEHKLGPTIALHHAHMIPQGLPGAGNIMIFDNGGSSGFGRLVPGSSKGTWPNVFRDYSRVIEFDPITLEIVWEYQQPNATADYDGDGDIKGSDRKFFGTSLANAQRLVNGNTLICEGPGGRVFEVTKAGKIVWEYVSPYATEGFRGMIDRSVYRAYRVPASWLPEGAEN